MRTSLAEGCLTRGGGADILARRMAKLLYSEAPPGRKTVYEAIPLGSESPADVMTAIYVPPLVSGNSPNLLLWFHGHKADTLTIDRYLVKTQYHFREELLRMGAQ